MGGPLVLPEGLVALVVGLPVSLHEAQGGVLAGVLEESGDVLVVTRGVAVLLVGPVAVVGPETMDRPRIIGAGHGVGIPELDLLDQAVRAADAAGVGGRATAGELIRGIGAGLVRPGEGDREDDGERSAGGLGEGRHNQQLRGLNFGERQGVGSESGHRAGHGPLYIRPYAAADMHFRIGISGIWARSWRLACERKVSSPSGWSLASRTGARRRIQGGMCEATAPFDRASHRR